MNFDLSPSRKSALYLGAQRRCSIDDAAKLIAYLSVKNAKKHVGFLLKRRKDFIGGEATGALDAVIVRILDEKNLLGSGVISNKKLHKWLKYAHDHSCGAMIFGSSPLYGVIHRIAAVVSDDKHIRECLRTVITHLLHSCQPDKDLCFRVLTQLLRKTAKNGKPFPELFLALTVCNYCPGSIVLECAAEIVRSWPSAAVGDESQQVFERALTGRLIFLDRFRGELLHEDASTCIAEAVRALRTWIEVGLAVKSPYGGCSSSSVVEVVLKLLVCEDDKDMIKALVTLALWLSAAGAQLDRDNDEQRQLFEEVLENAPAVREAILTRVPCLQQICTRTIRHHLQGSIAVSSSKLPLPVNLQSYVAKRFLDVDPSLVDDLTDSVVESNLLPLTSSSYHKWRIELLWPSLSNVVFH